MRLAPAGASLTSTFNVIVFAERRVEQRGGADVVWTWKVKLAYAPVRIAAGVKTRCRGDRGPHCELPCAHGDPEEEAPGRPQRRDFTAARIPRVSGVG